MVQVVDGLGRPDLNRASADDAVTSATWRSRATALRLLVCYACGVLAAAQIGKLATLAPPMQRELGLGLTTMAWLIALIELGGVLLGARAGHIAQRAGLRRSLTAALLLLCAASAGLALSNGAAALVAWRLVEALGYVGVIVTAPVLIAEAAGPRHAAVLLAIWSTFVPVGLAIGAWAHSAVASAAGWRLAIGASAAASLLMAAAVWATHRPLGRGAGQPASVEPPTAHASAATWALAASFGAFAAFGIGVLALLPTLFVERGGLDLARAGAWTAWASFATVGGSIVATLVAHRPGSHRLLVVASLLLPALLLFVVVGDGMPVPAIGAAAVLLNALLGIFGGLSFAVLPTIAGGPARTAGAYGLLAQFGASGSLAGPPLMAAVVERAGWAGSAWLGAGLAVVGAAFALRAFRPGASTPS